MYIVEKSLATFGTFSVVLLITEKFILPISPSTHEHHFLISALDLAVPFMINYLLIFVRRTSLFFLDPTLITFMNANIVHHF